MKSTTRVFATAMLSALTVSCPSWALELPSIFGSGIVLQRGKPVTI